MVEMAFVVVPLALLLFGIIWFGVLMSFKQAVTQAAADGARAAVPYSGATGRSAAQAASLNAASQPLGSWSRSCTSDGMTCTATPVACSDPDAGGTTTCMKVTVVYDYKSHPILPNIPILSGLLPDSISSSATVQMNP